VRRDHSVIEGAYLRDVLDQPRALGETLAGLEVSRSLHELVVRLHEGKFKTIVLTGMGSSFHALHPLNLALIDHGLTALMLETSELLYYGNRLFDPQTLIVAVSQSGLSAEIVRLLEINHGKSSVIAITNTPGSPLAESADTAILTDAGPESSVSCKTYLASLMALQWLGDAIRGRDVLHTREELEAAAPAVRDYLANWREHVETLLAAFGGTRNLFLVGRGASLAAVGTGALIIKESDHFHAEGMSSAAFRHGPFEMLSDETFVLVFAGDQKTRNLNQSLCADIRAGSGRAELVGEGATLPSCVLPAAPTAIHPILEILPVQMVTLALAAQTGREAGRFERSSKITTTE
jgi:glucosamine--fructose-6-phosphate aminotransferase (isomerizing)